MKLFKRKKKVEKVPDDFHPWEKPKPAPLTYDEDDLKKLPKKRRKGAIKLFKEYEKGLVLKINADINNKEVISNLRKGV